MAIGYQKVHVLNPTTKKDIYYAKAKVSEYLTEEAFCERVAGTGSALDADEMRLAIAKLRKGLKLVMQDGFGVELSIGKWKPTATIKKTLGYGSVDDADKITASILEGGCEFQTVKTLVTDVANGCKFSYKGEVEGTTDTTTDDADTSDESTTAGEGGTSENPNEGA